MCEDGRMARMGTDDGLAEMYGWIADLLGEDWTRSNAGLPCPTDDGLIAISGVVL